MILDNLTVLKPPEDGEYDAPPWGYRPPALLEEDPTPWMDIAWSAASADASDLRTPFCPRLRGGGGGWLISFSLSFKCKSFFQRVRHGMLDGIDVSEKKCECLRKWDNVQVDDFLLINACVSACCSISHKATGLCMLICLHAYISPYHCIRYRVALAGHRAGFRRQGKIIAAQSLRIIAIARLVHATAYFETRIYFARKKLLFQCSLV
jgi:hypothetical protein